MTHPLLDCSSYIDTGWKSDVYMGDRDEQAVSILFCEFSLVTNRGDDVDKLSDAEWDRLPLKEYLCFDSPPTEQDIFCSLALRLDTIPSWYTSWWNKLEGVTLEPPHYEEERKLCIAERYNNGAAIIERRTHKQVMSVRMRYAWLFSLTGDMFSGGIAPRYFQCNELKEGMPGGDSRDFWALKEPTPLTKEDPWPEDTGKDDWKLERSA
jgi:hypothetical protein